MEGNETVELISKKDVLNQFNISYGSLYRWKRQGLIPEDWFIKKSTPTGQETFFPKALIMERIALILGSKDEASLEAIAKDLSGKHEQEIGLRFTTVYGGRNYLLKEISKIEVVVDGKTEDITERFQALLGKVTEGLKGEKNE